MSMTISDPGSNLNNMSAITVDETQSLAKFYEKNEEYRDTESEYEGCESLNKKIHFHTGDITDFSIDAIVCSVQPVLYCKPFGMHRQVISKAGPVYEETCREVGYCKAGEAFITDGFDLHAKYIIHTAGLSLDTTHDYEEKKSCLSKSYLSCLEIVKQSQNIRTLAFPCLGCGGGGIQLADAITIAVTSLRQWLETDNNLIHVDSILLVMYDENQWNDYSKELFKTFPYGKDLAGIDLETLTCVEERTLYGFVPQTAIASNILCYQYSKSAVRQVGKNLHSLVNQLQTKLGTRSEPTERYRNCGTFLINKVHKHRVVVYHSIERCTIEVQVISYSNSLDSFLGVICEEVQSLIGNYFTTNLENVTKHKTYIRCNNSTWGDTDGMIGTGRLARRMARSSTMQCRHRKSGNNMSHSVNLNEIAKFWIQQDQCVFNREPDEHNEMAEESEDSTSWPSLASLSSSDSGGKLESKVSNVTSETRSPARTPVEHSDDSSNTFSKVKNFVKGKLQLFTKSNKDTRGIAETEHDAQSSSYQPFSDSILPSECQQPTRERELQENTNIYSRYNISDLAEASEPSYGELPKYESHQETTEESGQTDSISSCNKMSDRTWQTEQTSAGRSRNSQLPTGIGQNTISLSRESHLSADGDSEQEQLRHRECLSSLSSDHNSNHLGACGRNSAGNKLGLNVCSSTERTNLSDKELLNIARMVGNRETQLGLELGLSYECIQRIKSEHMTDATMQAFCILREWKIQQRGKASIETLLDAMTTCSLDATSVTIFN